MDKIKRLINCPVPITVCNFKCHYCYIGQANDFHAQVPKLNYSPEFIARALSVERMGGICHFSLCGMGETLLAPYVVDLARCLLAQGHYVSIVTNGTISKRFDEICQFPKELLERLFIKFSFHYLELQRLDLTDVFFSNIRKIKGAGASFTVELTANDESVEYIDKIKEICMQKLGALCHIVESRSIDSMISRLTKLPYEEHINAWSAFESPSFNIQQKTWGIQREEFCYAGDWIVDFFMQTGDMSLCLSGGHLIQNIYENLDEPIHFAAIGTNCPWAHCCSPYVTLTSGAIPTLKTPTYTDMRNRICADGTEWLGPRLKQFFSSQLRESNEQYSEDKKIYIDALMAVEYDNKGNCYSPKTISDILEKHLVAKGIRSIAVFGTEKLGRWLVDMLMDTSIKIRFAITHEYICDNAPSLKMRAKRLIKYDVKHIIKRNEQPTLLNLYDRWPKTDAVIVSPYPDYNKFSKLISNKTERPVISLAELVD